MVGVLILVRENITELMPMVFACLGNAGTIRRVHDQIVKITAFAAERCWYSSYMPATGSSTSPAET